MRVGCCVCLVFGGRVVVVESRGRRGRRRVGGARVFDVVQVSFRSFVAVVLAVSCSSSVCAS